MARMIMLRTVDGSLNGRTVRTYEQGEEYDLPTGEGEIGAAFLNAGFALAAEDAPSEKSAPAAKDKMVRPGKDKGA